MALARGSAAGFSTSLGILAANGIYFAISATSLGALLLASAELFAVVKWAGAAYLIWTGARMLFASDQPEVDDASESTRPRSLNAFSVWRADAGRESEGAHLLLRHPPAIRGPARRHRLADADPRRQLDGDRARRVGPLRGAEPTRASSSRIAGSPARSPASAAPFWSAPAHAWRSIGARRLPRLRLPQVDRFVTRLGRCLAPRSGARYCCPSEAQPCPHPFLFDDRAELR